MCHALIQPQLLVALQYLSSVVAMVGTILMAVKLITPRVAFWCWLFSYLVYIPYCGLTTQWGLFAGALGGLAINLIGVIQWRKPKKNDLKEGHEADLNERLGQEKASTA